MVEAVVKVIGKNDKYIISSIRRLGFATLLTGIEIYIVCKVLENHEDRINDLESYRNQQIKNNIKDMAKDTTKDEMKGE